MPDQTSKHILLTGATGFVGHRLLPALLDRGWRVRALSRDPARGDLPDDDRLDLVRADVLDPSSLTGVFDGIDAAYYLIHSMEGGPGHHRDFLEHDRSAAAHFRDAAAEAAVDQIVYLSGLAPDHHVSDHLRSRLEVEKVLREGPTPVTVLRAGFIIGPGSAGMRMLEALAERMETLIAIPDFDHVTQPAFIDDVVQALAACAAHPERTRDMTFEVGSREAISYRELIATFGQAVGSPVDFVDVPWVPRGVAAAFISSISHLPYTLVRELSEGLRTDLCVTDTRLYDWYDIPRTPPEEAIRQSVARD